MKSVIISLISQHAFEGKLKFTNYDGNIQSDVAQACSEISTDTALGSYAVEYMSFDLNKIVTYYEATIYITYRHSKLEIENIRYISGKSYIFDEIDSALENFKKETAVSICSESITEEMVKNAVDEVYSKNPDKCVIPPKATVTIHPKQGVYRIIEISFEYAKSISDLKKMGTTLSDKIETVYSDINNSTPFDFVRDAYNTVVNNTKYDAFDNERGVNTELEDALGGTAYGALVEGIANSRGIAVAYNALCSKAGIECVVVNGLLNNQSHSWNIVTIDDVSYHVDVSANATFGIEKSLMAGDEQMQSYEYWWEIENYPTCQGMKSIQDTIARF